jgi:hypothetical protein
MYYVNLIAQELKIDKSLAQEIYGHMYIPGGFSNATKEELVSEAKLWLKAL